MATLIINRSSEYANALRNISIYIDGEYADKVGNGENCIIPISDGHHSVVAKIDWCSSREISFYAFDNDTIHMSLSGFRNSKPFFIIVGVLFICQALLGIIFKLHLLEPYIALIGIYLLYYVTIGRKHYLTLKLNNDIYAVNK